MKKPKSFEKSFNGLQKVLMAEMLKKNAVDVVKHTLKSRNVEYTDELAQMIVAKYGIKEKE